MPKTEFNFLLWIFGDNYEPTTPRGSLALEGTLHREELRQNDISTHGHKIYTNISGAVAALPDRRRCESHSWCAEENHV